MKLFKDNATRLIALLVVTTFGLAACGGGSSIEEPKPLTPLAHPDFNMKVVWQVNAGDGAGQYINGLRPAESNEQVYVANQGGMVIALDLNNGHTLWQRDTGKKLVSGPVIAGDTLLVGTRKGEILALSRQDGTQKWSSDLSSVVLSPVAVSDGLVVAKTIDGHIAALDLSTGNRVWTIEGGNMPSLTIHGSPTPLIKGQTVYVGTDGGKLLALDLQTGETRWSQRVALPTGRSELDRIADVDADPLILGDTIYAASAGDALAALSLSDGEIKWKKPLSSVSELAIDDHNIYAIDMDGVIVAASQDIGGLMWMQDALEYRRPSSPAVVDGHILVGDFEGYLHWISPENGEIVGRGRPFDSAIRAQPVVVGDEAIVLSADGDVALVRFTPD